MFSASYTQALKRVMFLHVNVCSVSLEGVYFYSVFMEIGSDKDGYKVSTWLGFTKKKMNNNTN